MRFKNHIKLEEMPKLDSKDRMILYSLSENARTPYTEIAKKVRLSKDSVKYRIKNLEKEGVIQGYVTVVDIAKLGFNTYHLFLQLNRLDNKVRNELVNILKSYPFVKVIIEFSGKYTLEVGVASKSIEDLDEITTKVVSDVSQYIQESQVLIVSKYYDSKVFPKNFVDVKQVSYKSTSYVKGDVDSKDIEILKILSLNATLPLYKVASNVKLSPDAVSYRIKKMIKSGLIVKFAPVINYSALGYTVYAIIMNIHNLNSEKERILKSFFGGNENVLWAVKTIGKYNLLMYISTKDHEDLHKTLIKLSELFSPDIKDYETLVAYEEYKYDYFPSICSQF